MPLSTTELARRSSLTERHRPALVDLMLMDEMELRTGFGWRMRVEWGTPNADGIFEPLFHAEDDGKVLIDRDVLAELERRAAAIVNEGAR